MKHNVMAAFDDIEGDEEAKRIVVETAKRQTDEEQRCGESLERNNVGYGKSDAEIGMSLAEHILNDDYLSIDQMEQIRRLGKSYGPQDKDVKAGKRGV